MLASPLLKRISSYIDGQWIESRSTTPVVNPATGEHLADVPNHGAEQTTRAIESAERSLAATPTLAERSAWLSAIADRLMTHKDELARIITLEQGKPLKESAVEVEYSAGFFRYFARQLDHLRSRVLPEPIKNLRWTIHHRPASVVGLITPWNFPLAMLAKKLSAAIGAGCASITKPAANTPLSAVALWNLFDALGLPAGRVNLVMGDPPQPIGDTLCAHPAVRMISFTGSTEVGKALMANVAPHVKRLALELGGNAPFLVMDDADLPSAVDALMANKFRCAGQTCVCTNRVYLHKKIERDFLDAIVQRAGKLRVGNGMEPGVDIGPLINRQGWDKVQAHVEDARSQGARVLLGADRPRSAEPWGNFYAPTVLAGTTEQMLVSRQETFGPVIATGTFDDDRQAIRLANGTPFGLAAYVFTRDRARADRLIERLAFGHVGLNTGQGPTPEAPFGGMKQSGFGREGGLEGLLEFTETQTVAGA